MAAEYLALSSQIFENDLKEFIVLTVSIRDLDKLNFMKIGFGDKVLGSSWSLILPHFKSLNLCHTV